MPERNAPHRLRWLTRLNRTTVFLGTLIVALVGLFLPGLWGAVLLYAIVAALGWLMTRTWAASAQPTRVLRLLILAGLAILATIKIL